MERVDTSFSSNRTECAAWLYRPDGATGDVPCVVMAHGLSAVREQRLDAYAERFAEAGLAALLFDYRHLGASSGEPRQLVDIRRQLADWRSAVAYARGLDGVDPARIALFGSSFSGGHVLTLAAEDDRLAAVAAQCPFVDGLSTLRMMAPRQALRLTVAGLRDTVRARTGRAPYMIGAVGAAGDLAAMTSAESQPGFAALDPPGSSWRNEIAARLMLQIGFYRPGRRAARIACPLLLCVCENDSLAPESAAVKAAEEAPHGELKRYPIGHFDIYVGEWFERAVADQTAFFDHHLLGDWTASRSA